MLRTRTILVIAVAACLPIHARAGAIYQWEDETGRVQMSDVVPDKYKRTARRLDSRQFEVSPEQLKAAQVQAAALKARANEAASAPKQSMSTSAATSPAASAPKGVNYADCSAWRRAFVESRNCFGAYQTNHGPLRKGAYEACGPEVANPEPECGPEKWQ